MSNIRFYLNRTFANGNRAIQLRAYINKSLFTYQTGYSIIPELWNKETERPIEVKKKISPYKKNNPDIYIDLENIKTGLSNLTTSIKRELLTFNTNGDKVDFRELRTRLNNKHKEVKKTPKSLPSKEIKKVNEFIKSFLIAIKNGSETFTAKGEVKKYRPSTIKAYKEWETQFLLFEKTSKKVYSFDDITMDFYYKYVKHFVKLDYSTNSIGKQIKVLKSIMNIALDKGLHHNKEFQNKKFQTLKGETDSVYLTEKELRMIYEMDLSDRPNLERDRDIFLVGCWTALRFSDYSRIRPNYIKTKGKRKYIEIATRKTNEKVIIPIRPELDTILKKYSYNLPKTYEQKVNSNIKTIAKELEIDDLIEVSTTKGGLTEHKQIPKYKLIKTHTARRTGATLMYLSGISVLDICKITGHRKPESLLRYIKVSKEETAKELSLNPFFSGQKLKAV